MGKVCDTSRGDKNAYGYLLGKLMEGGHLEKLSANGRIILKCIFKKQVWRLVCIDLAQDTIRGRVFVNDDYYSGFIQHEFLDQLSSYQLVQRVFTSWSQLFNRSVTQERIWGQNEKCVCPKTLQMNQHSLAGQLRQVHVLQNHSHKGPTLVSRQNVR